MSNWSESGIRAACASSDARTRETGMRALSEWLKSSDPEKHEAAVRISTEALDKSAALQNQRDTEQRVGQIFSTFFQVHLEITDCVANRNILENWVVAHGGIFDLDRLEMAQEELGDQLSHQPLPKPVLSDADRLQAKLRAIRERNEWLKTLSQEELRGLARQEAEDRKHGRDPLADMRLSREEQEQVNAQPKVSRTVARLWVPNSNPRREFSSLELRRLPAQQFRAIISDGGGRTSGAKLDRANEILAGAQPEGVVV